MVLMNKDSIIKGIWNSKVISVDDVELDPRKSQAIISHSPDGFNWNYEGSGPSQLALALLLEVTTKENAIMLYQEFKAKCIACLPASDFTMSAKDIYDWLEKHLTSTE